MNNSYDYMFLLLGAGGAFVQKKLYLDMLKKPIHGEFYLPRSAEKASP
jgi:hypothetical protein